MSKQVEYSYIAIQTKPQNEQNEYTFALISMYSYIAILTKPQNEQNEYQTNSKSYVIFTNTKLDRRPTKTIKITKVNL